MTRADGYPCQQETLTCVGCRALRPTKSLLLRLVSIEVFPSEWLRRRLGRSGAVITSFSTSAPSYPIDNAGGPVTFAYVGALTPHKLGPLLEAFDLAATRIPTMRLVIAGAGPLEERVTNLVRSNSNVEYLGPIGSRQRNRLLRSATALVIPSTCEENSPLVFFEALAAGLPVVASDIGGLTELARLGNLILVAPGDPEALAEALVSLLSSSGRVASLRSAALRNRASADSARYTESIEKVILSCQTGP